MNTVQLTGYIKNVQLRGSGNYKVVTANLSQRNYEGKCLVTMPLVAVSESAKKQLTELTFDETGVSADVNIYGKLTTRFDRRPGLDNSERAKPYTQIEIVDIVSI